jgi:hypothetical protein
VKFRREKAGFLFKELRLSHFFALNEKNYQKEK